VNVSFFFSKKSWSDVATRDILRFSLFLPVWLPDRDPISFSRSMVLQQKVNVLLLFYWSIKDELSQKLP